MIEHISTVTAISTPPGSGGIAVIRLSGPDALAIADRAWRGTSLSQAPTRTAHLGDIIDNDGNVLDRGVATVFRAPGSFTGEDTVEFSVHGSEWIQRSLVSLLCSLGAEPAGPGEFTRRAYLNGRLDLAQAEGVADMIASSSRAAHRLAVTQMTGEFSRKLDDLRTRLINLASLLELELDFSEEEVEFADRSKLIALADEIISYVDRIASTYESGRAIKQGVPVVIAGAPNAGKSTLLNRLLDEEKAIVSAIPGTTRDVIEDTCEIDGILFRFFDTAGLRDTADTVESIGIERARSVMGRARIILWLLDSTAPDREDRLAEIQSNITGNSDVVNILIYTKSDIANEKNNIGSDSKISEEEISDTSVLSDTIVLPDTSEVSGSKGFLIAKEITISAKTGEGVENLEHTLVSIIKEGIDTESEIVITNARHQLALKSGAEALRRAREGITEGLSADLISQDIREALHHIGQVTGLITTPDLLTSIFTTFCIGK